MNISRQMTRGFRKSSSENIVTLIQFEKWEKLIKRLEQRLPHDLAQLSVPGHDDMLPIHWAMKHGPRLPKKALVALLNAFPQSSRAQDDEGSTPLHYAIFYGFANLDIIRILLSRYSGAVLVRDKYGRTPIFHAVAHKIGIKIEALKILLSVEGAAEALTIPCGPIPGLYENPAGSRGQSIENIHSRFQGIWKYPEEKRTPLYLMWDTAMNAHSSSRWFLKRSSESPKLCGKRMTKALFLLECAHLHQMGRPIDLYHRRRRKMIKKLLNYSECSLALQNGGKSQGSQGASSKEDISVGRHRRLGSFRIKSFIRTSSALSAEDSGGVSLIPRVRSRSDQVHRLNQELRFDSSRRRRNPELLRSNSRLSRESSLQLTLVSSTSNVVRIRTRSDQIPRLIHDVYIEHDDISASHRRSRTQSDLSLVQRKSFVASSKKNLATIFSVNRRSPNHTPPEDFSPEHSYDGFDPTMSEENSLDDFISFMISSHKRENSTQIQNNLLRSDDERLFADERYLTSSRSIRQRIMNRFRSVPNVFPIIHACLRLRQFLPVEIMDFSLEYYREQLDLEDEGNRPIHLAIELDSNACDIQKLLAVEEYGSASEKNGYGKLPLHLALMRPIINHDTVRLLMQAYPLGCLDMEEETHLYPFMLAAASNSDIGSKSSLTIIYEMLLMHPECASY